MQVSINKIILFSSYITATHDGVAEVLLKPQGLEAYVDRDVTKLRARDRVVEEKKTNTMFTRRTGISIISEW